MTEGFGINSPKGLGINHGQWEIDGKLEKLKEEDWKKLFTLSFRPLSNIFKALSFENSH